MSHLLIRRPSGNVAIMNVAEGADPAVEISKFEQLYGEKVSYSEIAAEEIPADRTFRDAWGHDLRPEMAKARKIWRDKIRVARAPKLAELDIEYQRADEKGDATKKAEIAAAKQALRDATKDPRIEAASTPEDLKAVQPASLEVR